MTRIGVTGHWPEPTTAAPETRESRKEHIREAILDQLGLELVPGREPIEMLVVEYVTNQA